MGKSLFCLLFGLSIFFCPLAGTAQDLSLSSDDLLIEMTEDGNFNLFIRSKPDISSVLLAETTKDEQNRANADNYGYRSPERNEINGDEIRLINGIPIPQESGIYSLISSTPKWHPELGWSYHIFIPKILNYGYEGVRIGQIEVENGTFFNIRTFYYAYADYRGPFMDNPFLLEFDEPKEEKPEEDITYREDTVLAFTEIAGENVVFLKSPVDLTDIIKQILEDDKSKKVDLVICLDATGSMRPYMDAIKADLIPMLKDIVEDYDSFRIGMVFYKDYYDDYLTRIFPFTKNFNTLQRNLNAIRPSGGGDIPEAVYEALHSGAVGFPWEAESRIMILIGDAPPHPMPRGKITKQMTENEIIKRAIKMHAVILPDPKNPPQDDK